MTPTTYGFDLDGTIDRDPEMMKSWIEQAVSRGHKVYCVTSRRNTAEHNDIVYGWLKEHGINVKVFFTSLSPKIDYMLDKGITVDVWLDNDPRTLVNGH
jgi:hypothetical protein